MKLLIVAAALVFSVASVSAQEPSWEEVELLPEVADEVKEHNGTGICYRYPLPNLTELGKEVQLTCCRVNRSDGKQRTGCKTRVRSTWDD